MTTEVLIDASDPAIHSTGALDLEILKQIQEQDVISWDAEVEKWFARNARSTDAAD